MTEMAARGATVEELESLYRADLPRFVRAATAIVGDEGAGRDAVQEAFVQAVRKRTGYKDEAPPSTVGSSVSSRLQDLCGVAAPRSVSSTPSPLRGARSGALTGSAVRHAGPVARPWSVTTTQVESVRSVRLAVGPCQRPVG